MKAQTWHGGARFTLDDIPDPEPSPGYVVVKIDTTGVCGTDVHVTQGLFPKDPPQILGHESSGTMSKSATGSPRNGSVNAFASTTRRTATSAGIAATGAYAAAKTSQ